MTGERSTPFTIIQGGLSETSLTLKAIAISSGYATAAHMGEVFQDKLCLTPLQYRQNALSGQDQS